MSGFPRFPKGNVTCYVWKTRGMQPFLLHCYRTLLQQIFTLMLQVYVTIYCKSSVIVFGWLYDRFVGDMQITWFSESIRLLLYRLILFNHASYHKPPPTGSEFILIGSNLKSWKNTVKNTLQGTNISHLGKRKIIDSKSALGYILAKL